MVILYKASKNASSASTVWGINMEHDYVYIYIISVKQNVDIFFLFFVFVVGS